MSGSAPPLWNPSGMRMNSEPPSQLRPPNADQYNNNPHSRNPTAQGGGQDDTWGWGWDDDTQAQDENDWGGPGWQKVDDGPTAQPAAPPPHPHPVGSIQRPITHHYPPANVAPPTKPVNSSDFFENVDLAGKNFYPSDNNNKFQDRFSNSPALSDHFQEHHNQYPHHQPPSNNTMQQVSLRGKEEEVQQQQQQQLQQQQGYSYFQFSPADNQTKLNELNDVLKPIPDLFGPPSAAPPHQGHAYNNLQPTQTTLNNSYSGMYNNYQHQNDNNSGFPDAKSSISSGPPTANAYYQPQKQIYGDQMQNYGDREQDYGDRKQDYGDQKQNYGDQMQNYSDHKQNYGDQMQNYSDHKQNYGDQMQNYGDQYGVQQQKTQGQQMMYPYSNSNVGVDSYATGYPNGAIQPPVTSSSSFSDSSLAPAPAAAAAAAAAATTAEVENVEVAPPEQPQKVSATNKSTSATSQQFAGGRLSGNSSFPDNQETVIPDNEERPSSHDADLLSSQMNSLRLNATTAAQQVASVPRQMPPVSSVESSSLDQWNAVPGWENQEVAPSPSPVSAGRAQTKRFTVDRNQYLETGHLSSNPGQITALDNDVDTNDEGEAAPPPGLHRLVTGQVTPGEVDHSDAVGVASVTSQQRMVVGSGQEPSLATRLVPGQGQSAAAGGGDQANLDGGGTQPPATAAPPQSSQSWRMSAQGDRPQQRLVPGQGDMNEVRLVAGQVDDQPPPLGQRLVPGQPSDDEVTGGGAGGVGAVPPPDSSSASTASSAASRGEVPGGSGLRGEVDGGGGDDDGDDDEESERRVPGMQQQQQMPGDGQDSEAIAAAGTSISVGASISAPGDASQRKANEQPPPAMQRFVLGHNNSAAEDRSRGGPLSGDEADAGSMGGPSGAGGNIPPPGFHRMVVGELRGKEKDVDRSRDKDTDAEDREKDRDTEYSDSDYRMNRSRKSRQRRDSYDDDRDSRASPSDRERSDRHAHHYQDYWDRHWESGGGGGSPKMAPSGGGSRNKHRSQRRSADRHSYDHSPEYRSEDDYEHRDRHDYRDHRRDRDRDRDRGDNDRDRRRRSPRPYRDDYYPYREDVDYRDDPRRRRSDRRMHYDSVYRGGEDYYSRENRSRPTSRSGSDYRRQGAPRDFVPTPRHHSSAYYPDPGTAETFSLSPIKLNASSWFPDAQPCSSPNIPSYSHLSRAERPISARRSIFQKNMSFSPSNSKVNPYESPSSTFCTTFHVCNCPLCPQSFSGAVNPYQYYYQMQQYYEDMRRNDPQRYASWYEQYMSGKLQYGQMPAGGAGPGSGVGVSNAATAANSSYDTDRASVHSGRSSAQAHRSQTDRSMNDISKTGDDDYGEEEEVESQRNTPLLFMGAHTKAHFGRQNQLAVVWPHYLLAGIDGGQPATATVSLLQLAAAAPSATAVADSDVAELLECPGPFTAGVTHKSTVVQYLKRRSEMSTRSSERLLYDLILLVVRLNGVVDKNDVAELLLSSYKEKKAMQQQQQQTAEEELASLNQQQQEVQGWSMDGNLASAPTPPPTLPQHEVVAKFRDLLLEGNKSDALEWAIQNKIWGHAFFLAYKMDARTYNNVILRFANGLAVNDPLQTLYQTMSGREPQAATCAADKKWGDWRTHLAMMLSNPSGNADLDRKSVITLGDSLANRGRLFAAHFCYLTAQVKFSDYTDRSAKLVLLGSSHHLPFNKFATCRAIMLSLCYEYAMRLNKKDFIMPALQTYKYLLAVRLAECNKLSAALQHLEYLAIDLTNLPTADSRQLAIRVAELADQLKLADPSLSLMADPDEDPDWLAGLKQMLDDISDANLQTSNMSRAISTSTVSTSGADLNPNQQGMDVPLYGDSTNVHSWSSQQQQQTPMTYDPSQADNTGMLNPNSVPMVSNLQQPYQQSQFQPDYSVPPTYGIDQPVSSIPQQQNQQQSWDPTAANSWQHQHMYQDQQQQQQQYAMQEQQQLNQHQPADHTYSNSGITLSSGPSSYYSGTSQQQNQQPSQPSNDNKEAKPQSTEKSSSRKSNKKAKEASNSTGWFGGIWSTFSLKPKNQMKLPDDKNPSIIWDDKLGKWVNTDGDEEDEAEKLKPPPKAADIPGFRPANMVAPADGGLQHPSAGLPTMQPVPSAVAAPAAVPTLATGLISQPLQPLSNNASSAVTNAAPAATGPPSVNMYKMKRGKGVKSNYVNVLDSIKNSHQPPGPDLMMATGPSSLPPPANNFFIPAPMEGNENAPIDFLTPSGPVSYESTSQSKGLDQQQPAEAPYGSLQQSATYYR